ncbi:MAG: UDP-2,3-diacylglucosamine diphosphatase, partial [Bdellovibrionota bacterium]
MKVFFLSDLHLDSGSSPAAMRFVQFLASEPKRGEILLLGGDIFDLLVGNKRIFRTRFASVLNAITEAGARGVQVHYLEGNHDFHFAGLFRGQGNVHVHTADFAIPERAIWVSHGDLIDKEDKGYRFLRFVTKNAPFRAFVWSMPEALVDFIGSRSSGASRKYTSGRVENEGTERLRRIYFEFAGAKIREGYRHVLVG